MASDVGASAPFCGDGLCLGEETTATCSQDCGEARDPDVADATQPPDAAGAPDVQEAPEVADPDPPDPLNSVAKWRRKVFSFSTSAYEGNPFEVVIEATFTHVASGTQLTVPGYYDGGDTWRVGFMATRLGAWTFTTTSPTAALSGHSGAVEAVASGHRGLLAKDNQHPDKWRFADAGYVVPIGVFVNAMLEDASNEQFTAMADFVAGGNLHLLNFRLSENDKAFENVGGNTMHLARWQRLEARMEILTERGLGVDLMLYTDDSGKPSFGPQSAQEKLLIRTMVARLCGFQSVMFNTGIDLMEYRDPAWVNWYGDLVRGLDPYDHPVSSRYGGGSGNAVMAGQTYNSVGDRNSTMSGLLAAGAPGDGVPGANNDNWSEDLADNKNGHTPQDIRRAAWKAAVAGGVAFHVRHNTLFCPAGITECDRYFHIASLADELDSEQWLARVAPFVDAHLGEAFGAMQPAPGLVVGGGGKYALADPARTRMLFLLLGKGDSWDAGDGGAVTVDLGGVGGSFEALWFDPRTGAESPAGAVEGGKSHTFAPPSAEDWLLVLED